MASLLFGLQDSLVEVVPMTAKTTTSRQRKLQNHSRKRPAAWPAHKQHTAATCLGLAAALALQATAACAHTTANTLHRRVLLESSTVSVGPDNTVYRDAYPKPELELPEKQLIFFIFLGIILVLFVSMHAFFAFMKCTNKEWKENQVVPEDGEGEGDEESASKSPRGADDSNSNASAPATPASSAAVPKPKSKLRGVKAWKAAAEARQQHPRFIWLQNAMVQVLEQTEKYEKERKVELKEQEAKYEKLKAAAKTASAVALFKRARAPRRSRASSTWCVRPTHLVLATRMPLSGTRSAAR
ncbi:hypothetical protein NFJ02_11g05260 [Pycnococcus provasolii]